jgi:hypothetical protein
MGRCAVYDVQIDGSGTVRYDGKEFAAVKGPQEAHISADAVHALYDAFAKADFFWTFDSYKALVSDLPAYTMTISFDGQKKTLVDYDGLFAGLPKEVAELEPMIDNVAGTAKWVKGPSP